MALILGYFAVFTEQLGEHFTNHARDEVTVPVQLGLVFEASQ